MKIYYRGNKLTEIIILSVAIIVAVVEMIIFKKSFWFILPYIILEGILLYFLLNFHYLFENTKIKTNYGFYTCKEIPIQSIRKIVIQDKQKFEPQNSLHRIEIHYGMNKIQIVKPKETVSFIENIERLRPDIEII